MSPLVNKQLFLIHLAQNLGAMEQHALPMSPVAYRLYARRLRAALPGYLPSRPGVPVPQAISEALEDRYFCEHGCLPGPQGGWVQAVAEHTLRAAAAA